MIVGLVIGVIFGAVQFWCLRRFTRGVTGGVLNNKVVLFGMIQFFIPLIVLVAVGLFYRRGLVYAGVGLAVTLIFCAVTNGLRTRKRENRVSEL